MHGVEKTLSLERDMMCNKERPDAKAVLENLKQPLSFGKKMQYIIRNNILKIVRLNVCCGHPGEPGC
jgi:hypothetical protein